MCVHIEIEFGDTSCVYLKLFIMGDMQAVFALVSFFESCGLLLYQVGVFVIFCY